MSAGASKFVALPNVLIIFVQENGARRWLYAQLFCWAVWQPLEKLRYTAARYQANQRLTRNREEFHHG